jgi:outer membrane protein TolC
MENATAMPTRTLLLQRRVLVGSVLLLGGCASTLAGPDIARVRSLTHAAALPDPLDGNDTTSSREVAQILAQPLDVDSAVRLAMLNNRELRAAFHDLGIARGNLVQAGLLPNPVIEAGVPVEPEIRYEVGIEFDLTDAVLAPLRARVAASDLESARYRTAAAVVDLGFRVRSAFYAAQAAEQELTVARRTLDTLAAGRDAARALLDAGNIPELGLASQEAAFERARVMVAQLELEVARAREQLNTRLGLHGDQSRWSLRGPLPATRESEDIPRQLEGKVVEASLELAEARSRLDSVARRTGLSRAEGWLPEIALSASTAQVAHAGGPERERRWGAGVTLSVPLFDRKQGRTHALTSEFDGLLDRYHAMAVTVRAAAREAASGLTSAHARARQYERVILPAQRRVTHQTLLQFNAMQVGIFQLLVARREELDAELAYVETLREYWTAKASLDAVLGGIRPGPIPTTTGTAMNRSESGGGH